MLCDHCLHDLHLYNRKMLTNREKVNFQKWDILFYFSLYFTINCVTTGAWKKPIEYIICFIYSQQCITIISLRKMCGFISSIFKNFFPNNTTPTFQEVGGVTQPRIFCWWHKNVLWYLINNHKIDWFLLTMWFYFFVCHCFQLKWTRTSTHSKTLSAHGEILKVIFPLFWFGFKVCSAKIPTYCIFKLLSLICFQNMSIVTCDFRRKNAHIAFLSKQFWYCCSCIYSY